MYIATFGVDGLVDGAAAGVAGAQEPTTDGILVDGGGVTAAAAAAEPDDLLDADNLNNFNLEDVELFHAMDLESLLEENFEFIQENLI